MIVRSLERESFTEWHLTCVPPPVRGRCCAVRGGAARMLLEEAASQLARCGIEPVQEKLYGSRSTKEEVLALRRDVLREHGLDPELPCTFVEGQPVAGEGLAGLQLWGLTGPARRGVAGRLVESIRLGEGPGAPVGRAFRVSGGRFLYVPSLTGRGSDGLAADPAVQADAMFARAEGALASQGFGLQHAVRTWLYLSRLLDWYGRFNEVRTRRYRAAGMIGERDPAPAVPASTGIQGRTADEECLLDLLAVEPGTSVQVERIRQTARQGAAYGYGSAFCRGLALGLEGRRTVFVSGTASIDPTGATAHAGDAEAQCVTMLLCVAALLEEQGGSLARLLQGTLFCKTPEVYEVFQRVTRQLGIPELPLVPVVADVCRPELLVEVEAVGAA